MEKGFWFDTCPELQGSRDNIDGASNAVCQRSALSQDIVLDVAIIGAGYSGLWTAYYLKRDNPSLKIAIFEADTVGQGASGRNGGWLMGGFSGDIDYLNQCRGEQRVLAKALIHSAIEEVGAVCQRHNIDCDLVHGGNLRVAARYPEQLLRLQKELTYWRNEGFGEEDVRWLDGSSLSSHINMHQGQAALFTPHCARIHPAKLVTGLASAVESLGVRIYENTRVSLSPSHQLGTRELVTPQARICADIIVPAIEGYQRQFSELGRFTLPVQSLLIATEPLPQTLWNNIGLSEGQTFSDASRIMTYGQRSPDNRLIFGARGGYQFGAKIRTEFGFDAERFNRLTSREREQHFGDFNFRYRLMLALFPQLTCSSPKGISDKADMIAHAKVKITHGWGGTLAVARKFAPHAIFDKATGVALIGGYGGEGVGAANLFGRTLAALILERDNELTSMPWAYQASPNTVLKRWEPEPFRWLAYRGIGAVFSFEDALLSNPNTPKWQRRVAAAVANPLESLLS